MQIVKMFTDLNNFLTTSSCCLKQCKCIGVCESKADSGFFFHHAISYFLKNDNRVFLLSFCQSFTHFNNVGNKTGSNLTEERKKSNLVFLEGLKNLGESVTREVKDDNPWKDVISDTGAVDARKLYQVVKTIIDSCDSALKPVLIIDNISLLMDIGMNVKDLINFISYIRNYVCNIKDGSCMIGVNNDCGLEDEDGSTLWRVLQYMSDVTLEVRGLESGYCRDVHGQIKAEWKSPSIREKPTVKEAQFKLTDKNCSIFAAGMSSAVL